MRWLNPHLRTVYGLLGRGARLSDAAIRFRTEEVRQAMLDAVDSVGYDERHTLVIRKIRYADGVQSLWFIRSELMAVLADIHGETVAQAKLRTISDLFRDLVPVSLTARNSGTSVIRPSV